MLARNRLAIALLASSLVAVPAFAQDAPNTNGGDTNRDWVMLGVGAGVVPSYEGSDDYQITPVPGAIGQIGGMNFTLIGNRASLDLIPDGNGPGWDFQLGPVASVNLNRNRIKGIDDARVAALGKIDMAIEVGGYVGIGKTGVFTSDYDRISLSVSWRHDVAGGHDSAIISPLFTYFTPLSTKAAVGLTLSAEHVGEGYADTYFSVTPAGSVATGGILPVYNAREGWKSWTAGLLGTVALTGDLTGGLSLVGGGGYRRLLNDAADSPVTSIAGSRDQWYGALGLAYTF